MKIVQVILIAFTALSGCTKNNARPAANQTATPADTTKTNMTGTLNYLALGDSYTIGQSVPQDQSYPYQLAAALNNNSLKVNAPDIIAVTGWTTDNLIDAIDHSAFKNKKYNFVTLLIGVNDQFQHLSQDNYKIKFKQVLQTAINFAHGDTAKVFVISIPDYGVTPFANGSDSVIGPEIDQFNAINAAEAKQAGVNYLDITPISRQAATDLSLVADDGLHPSGKMYTAWVNYLNHWCNKKLANNLEIYDKCRKFDDSYQKRGWVHQKNIHLLRMMM